MTTKELLHDIDMLMLKASNKLHLIELSVEPDKLNASMYDALQCAEKEMKYIFAITGHGCDETMRRVRYAIEDYEKVQKVLDGKTS